MSSTGQAKRNRHFFIEAVTSREQNVSVHRYVADCTYGSLSVDRGYGRWDFGAAFSRRRKGLLVYCSASLNRARGCFCCWNCQNRSWRGYGTVWTLTCSPIETQAVAGRNGDVPWKFDTRGRNSLLETEP